MATFRISNIVAVSSTRGLNLGTKVSDQVGLTKNMSRQLRKVLLPKIQRIVKSPVPIWKGSETFHPNFFWRRYRTSVYIMAFSYISIRWVPQASSQEKSDVHLSLELWQIKTKFQLFTLTSTNSRQIPQCKRNTETSWGNVSMPTIVAWWETWRQVFFRSYRSYRWVFLAISQSEVCFLSNRRHHVVNEKLLSEALELTITLIPLIRSWVLKKSFLFSKHQWWINSLYEGSLKIGRSIEPQKKNSYVPLYCLFNRDPYNGLV